MCGIGGIWRRDGGRPELAALGRMMGAIAHRGPEGAAHARLDRGALLFGFLRLGFTAGGLAQQPIYNEDRTIAVLFNGELYGHDALRGQLEARGHRFRTRSDSEVIVHLYEEHGERFHEHLDGELAIVLWDGRRRELLALRDPHGLKPLFYAWHEGAFVFASEAKALHALPGFEVALDPGYWTGPGVGVAECTSTPFVGIRSVRPGHLLRVGVDRVRETPWLTPRATECPYESVEDAAGALRAALTRSVGRRLEGDPPLAVSLSSGIDSSIVLALAVDDQRARGREAHAFGLGYDGASYDESAAAARTAASLGARFTRVRCTPSDIAEALLPSVHSVEVATNSLSTAARCVLAREVRAHGFKALMSGEGSDELFGGYPYFGVEAIARMTDRARHAAAMGAFRASEALSKGMFWDDDLARARTYGFASAYEARVRRTGRAMRWMFSRDWLARMGGRTPWSTACSEHDPRELRAMDPFDATRTISRSVLASLVVPALGDRVEMSSSLEGRAPYLGREVVALAWSLPERFCIDPRTQTRKWVLRRAFADRLPAGLRPPPKHTRMAPTFADLARTPRGREVLELCLDPRAIRRAGIFDPRFVTALRLAWRAWPEGGRRHAMLDMTLGYVAMTQALYRVHVEDLLGRRSAPSPSVLEDRSPPALAPAMAVAS